MEDVKAMEAVFSSDLTKTVLSKLSVRSHAQIISYWQQKSKEWLNTQWMESVRGGVGDSNSYKVCSH